MLHIDPATLRRHPWIAVILGLATAAVIGFLLVSGMSEARQLLLQKSPRSLTVHETLAVRGVQWIELRQGEWRCDQALTIERGPGMERWVLGGIEATEIPITDAVTGEVVIACFDGAVSCEAKAGAPLRGVIGSTEIFTSRATMRRWNRHGGRVTVLNVGASPSQALTMLVGLVAIALLGIGFAAYYARLMLPRREPRAAGPAPAYVPIEPR